MAFHSVIDLSMYTNETTAAVLTSILISRTFSCCRPLSAYMMPHYPIYLSNDYSKHTKYHFGSVTFLINLVSEACRASFATLSASAVVAFDR